MTAASKECIEKDFLFFCLSLIALIFSLFNRKENAPRILVGDSILLHKTLGLNLGLTEVRDRALGVAALCISCKVKHLFGDLDKPALK